MGVCQGIKQAQVVHQLVPWRIPWIPAAQRLRDWRSSAQVKGLGGLLVTKMSNRKEGEGRERLLLFEVLLAALLLYGRAF